MQSSYEIFGILSQQELIDSDGCSSAFPLSNPPMQNHHYPLLQNHNNSQFPLHLEQQNCHINHQINPTPFTHQFLQHRHQFPPLQRREELQRGSSNPQSRFGEGVASQSQQSFFPVNFKLGLNENSICRDERVVTGDFLGGNEVGFPENQPHSLGFVPRFLQTQEYSANKEPFCSLCTDASNANRKNSQVDMRELGSEYRNYGELESIYNIGKMGETNHTGGSGSALTSENSPANVNFQAPVSDIPEGQNVGATPAVGVDNGSEASIGEEALLRKIRGKKRKRAAKELLGSMTGFFESLVKQVMGHQEVLHEKFIEASERMDEERKVREEAWRREVAEKHNREAIARVHEQTLASSREAALVSYMEKITGQRVTLPSRKIPLLLQPDRAFKESTPISDDTNGRWPRSEVEALIQVRSGLELQFHEPGLKGSLWENVSSLMASMGYQRSARRCKEKWENINKYFRKTKDSSKNRSKQSKTCSYFEQLDQLYSRTPHNFPGSSPSDCYKPSVEGFGVQRESHTELFEDCTDDSRELGQASGGNFEISEMGSNILEFDSLFYDGLLQGEEHGNQRQNDVDDEDFEDEVEEEEKNQDEED
ncbi:hypothetical protein UlMin_035741 [Ulmus minor]